jgi:cellulose synthase/poly-beta-1,6-N-acetylglucosamine synthase-like glycosyltransferase
MTKIEFIKHEENKKPQKKAPLMSVVQIMNQHSYFFLMLAGILFVSNISFTELPPLLQLFFNIIMDVYAITFIIILNIMLRNELIKSRKRK